VGQATTHAQWLWAYGELSYNAEIIEDICRDTQSEDESDSNNTTEELDDTDVTDKPGALLYCCNQGHVYDLRFPIYNHPCCCPAHNMWLSLCSANRKQ